MGSMPIEVPKPWTPRVGEAAALLAIGGVLGWAYGPSFVSLVSQWNREPNYSYGFFVIPIAIVIFWSRRDLLDRSKMRPKWWGFIPLAGILALRYSLYEWNEQYIETATIPLVIASLALALGGWHLLRVAFPAILFLFFMLPLPPRLNLLLSAQLQRIATLGSVLVLQIIGLPVISEGNTIVVGSQRLEVERACNGLSMLLSFVTLITAVAMLVRKPLWERLLLLSTVIPIALISNILRISVTALCYHWIKAEVVDKWAHDFAGWVMMPVGLALVLLELRLWSWLVVPAEPEEEVEVWTRKKPVKS